MIRMPVTKDDLKPVLDLLIQRSFTDRKSATLEELAATVGIDIDKPWSRAEVLEQAHALAVSSCVASERTPEDEERTYTFRGQCDDAREMLVGHALDRIQQVVDLELSRVLPNTQTIMKEIRDLVDEHVATHFPLTPATLTLNDWTCPVVISYSNLVCGAPQASRTTSGHIVITCTNNHHSGWPSVGRAERLKS